MPMLELTLALLLLPQPLQAGDSGQVVLSVDDYRALKERAFPPEPKPTGPPLDATLVRIDYELEAQGELVSGQARLDVVVFKEGFVRVPLPTGLLVSSARLEGRPLSLLAGKGDAKAGSGLELVFDRMGPATIVLEVSLPARLSAGTQALGLPPAAAALQRATLTVPRAGVEIQVTSGTRVSGGELNQRSTVVATAPGATPLAFTWRQRPDQHRAPQPLRLRGSLTSLVGLAEESAQVRAELRLEVLQGEASSFEIELPEGLTVTDVGGPSVADWAADGRRLKVALLEPLSGAAGFTLQGEQRVAREGQLQVPILRLLGVERESGGVAVEVLGAGEIRRLEPKALDPADASELGGPVAGRDSPSLVAYRYRPQKGTEPRALTVDVVRYTPQAVLVANVEEARHQVLLTEDGKRLVAVRYGVRNNQRGFLSIRLPDGAVLWSAAVDGRPVRPGRGEAEALLLPLRKGGAGESAPLSVVELTYLERAAAWPAKGSSSFRLPAGDLPVSRTGLELLVPARFKVLPGGGPLQPGVPLPPIGAETALGERRSAESGAGAGKQLESQVQGLLDRFQKDAKVLRAAGSLPVEVPFPRLGNSLYLTSQLTREGEAPSVELTFVRQRSK